MDCDLWGFTLPHVLTPYTKVSGKILSWVGHRSLTFISTIFDYSVLPTSQEISFLNYKNKSGNIQRSNLICYENNTKGINIFYKKNVEFLNVKTRGTFSNHCTLKACLQLITSFPKLTFMCLQYKIYHQQTWFPFLSDPATK